MSRLRQLAQRPGLCALLIAAWLLAALFPAHAMHAEHEAAGFAAALNDICGEPRASAMPEGGGTEDLPGSNHLFDCPYCSSASLGGAWAPLRTQPVWHALEMRPLVPDCVRMAPTPALHTRNIAVRGPPAAARATS